jgi:cGMP-specific 3',5'-cyclic phosphodiesterase
MKIVEKSILSTDLAMYFRKKDRFIELIENGEIAWQGEEKKERK